jgi:hypothetical protein
MSITNYEAKHYKVQSVSTLERASDTFMATMTYPNLPNLMVKQTFYDRKDGSDFWTVTHILENLKVTPISYEVEKILGETLEKFLRNSGILSKKSKEIARWDGRVVGSTCQ